MGSSVRCRCKKFIYIPIYITCHGNVDFEQRKRTENFGIGTKWQVIPIGIIKLNLSVVTYASRQHLVTYFPLIYVYNIDSH